MKISISTLARSFNLSDEALRFYERKGLLNPSRLNEGGYRKFDRVDIQRVANIKRLKNQGFLLDEIRSVYENIGQAEMLRLEKEKLGELEREIKYKENVSARMRESIERVERAEGTENAPVYLHSERMYMLEYDTIEALWAHVGADESLKKMFCFLPLTSFTSVIPRTILTGGEGRCCSMRKGVLIDRAGAEILQIDTSDFRVIDASYAVRYMLRVVAGEFSLARAVPLLKKFLAENNLTVSDDLFTLQLMNFNLEDGRHVHYTDLIVPVERSELDIG
ncbi:MAG: MerR family transcriptional regulator [Clostridia bacterium]